MPDRSRGRCGDNDVAGPRPSSCLPSLSPASLTPLPLLSASASTATAATAPSRRRGATVAVRAQAAKPTPVATPPPLPYSGPIILPGGQIAHSLTQERLEVVRSLDGWAGDELVKLLKPVEKCWQPNDLLPNPADPDFEDQVRELRKRSAHIPDDHLVCLVGDMITEEALPTYMNMLNTLDGVRDETGASDTAWARWTRQWTAEENRHGDAMNKYLWLTGRVNMRAVEVTIQNLIGSGMDPKTENNPYLGFVYTSFQERATKISHGNTANAAKEHGDEALANLCGLVAADESRHEIAYTRIVDKLFEKDPDGAMLAFADMMRKQIVMPAHLMDDNEHGAKNGGRNLFADFSAVAETTGTYSADDYASIMEHLVKRWEVKDVAVTSGEAAEAQEYVMKLPGRIRKLAERAASKRAKADEKPVKFSWIYDRPQMIRG